MRDDGAQTHRRAPWQLALASAVGIFCAFVEQWWLAVPLAVSAYVLLYEWVVTDLTGGLEPPKSLVAMCGVVAGFGLVLIVVAAVLPQSVLWPIAAVPVGLAIVYLALYFLATRSEALRRERFQREFIRCRQQELR